MASVNALRDTKAGEKIIQDAICHNKDDSITVYLKGVNKSYTYTPEQIGAHEYTNPDKKYSSGDIDMNLIEMAFNDYRKEILADNPKAFGDLRKATLSDPLEGGHLETVIKVLTGKDFDGVIIKPRLEKVLQDKQKKIQNYAMLTSFKNKDSEIDGIITNHAYSIKRVTKNCVYVVNPHDSSKEIAYPKNKFLENAEEIVSFDLKKD